MSAEFYTQSPSDITINYLNAWQKVDREEIPALYQKYINDNGVIPVAILKLLGMPIGRDAVNCQTTQPVAENTPIEEPLAEAQVGGPEIIPTYPDLPRPIGIIEPGTELYARMQEIGEQDAARKRARQSNLTGGVGLFEEYEGSPSQIVEMTPNQEYPLPTFRTQSVNDSEKKPWAGVNRALNNKHQKNASRGPGRYSGRF